MFLLNNLVALEVSVATSLMDFKIVVDFKVVISLLENFLVVLIFLRRLLRQLRPLGEAVLLVPVLVALFSVVVAADLLDGPHGHQFHLLEVFDNFCLSHQHL
jgi:hypothetical protein